MRRPRTSSRLTPFRSPLGIAGQVRYPSPSRYLDGYRSCANAGSERSLVSFFTMELVSVLRLVRPRSGGRPLFVGLFELGTIKAGIETGFAPICPTDVIQTGRAKLPFVLTPGWVENYASDV